MELASSPSIAFSCALKPFGRLSFKGPVFLAGARCLRGNWFRLSPCLLILTITHTPKLNRC